MNLGMMGILFMNANVKNMKCTGLKAAPIPIHESKLKVMPFKYALIPVYFIFSVRVRFYSNQNGTEN